MASIRHRKRTSGRTSWQVLFRAADGRQTSQTFELEREARQFAKLVDDLGPDEALTIQREREGSSADTPTLRAWALEHIDDLTGVTDGTRGRYRRYLETHLTPLAPLPLDAITPVRVSRWVNSLERKGLSGKTISNLHGFLSSVFKGAMRRGLADTNPCAGTRIPKTEREEMVTLTDTEFATFLEHVRPDARDLVTCLPLTGLRFGEITALQVRDVDFNGGKLSVTRAWKYAEDNARTLGPPKSRRSRRIIPLPPRALEALARACASKGPTDFVFTNTTGGAWTRPRFHEGVWQPAVRAAFAAIGKRPRVHDMRHTCASWMLNGGAPMFVVQRHLGHESITTTESVYSHLDPSLAYTATTALAKASAGAFPEIDAEEIREEIWAEIEGPDAA